MAGEQEAVMEESPKAGEPAAGAAGEAEKLVPVSEAIRYRKRAQAAEEQLRRLEAELEALRKQAQEAQETIARLERRQQIDALLTEADVIDLEAARLLTEAAIAGMSEPDVKLAIEDLRRHKPWLFRRSGAGGAMAMGPRQEARNLSVEEAAQAAAASGDRRDLLRYLRLRRSR